MRHSTVFINNSINGSHGSIHDSLNGKAVNVPFWVFKECFLFSEGLNRSKELKSK